MFWFAALAVLLTVSQGQDTLARYSAKLQVEDWMRYKPNSEGARPSKGGLRRQKWTSFSGALLKAEETRKRSPQSHTESPAYLCHEKG